MYCIEISKEINNIMSLFYYLGLWHHGDQATVRETRIKLFYCFYYLLFPISLVAGAIKSDNQNESIYLVEMAIAVAVLYMKLYYIIWKKDQILEIIARIGVYEIKNREEFTSANEKMKKFMKFTKFFLCIACVGGITALFAPIFVKERTLFYNIGFPFDWRNNKMAFWLANAFIFTEVALTLFTILFSVTIWYLMINCALRYELLGSNIRNMGVIEISDESSNKRKISDGEKNNVFLRDLIAAIDAHQLIRGLIKQLASLISNIFFIQIVTSGLCICNSTYCLAFNVGETLVELLIHVTKLMYHVFDIFMIMYFGNEIKLSSDRLSYRLFESNWIDKPQETKKCIIVFGELLQQPHVLVVGKLYPLTLETFRRILNFAYNTFNILKNFK